MRIMPFALWALALLSGDLALAEPKDEVLVVADFDGDIQNRLGGYHNVFQRAPSRAWSLCVKETCRGSGGRSLQLRADRQAGGFCGLWMHFFDFRADAPAWFDSRPYRYLSFWIKGESGGEPLEIKLADRVWVDKEDAVSLGPIDRFLEGGIRREWQEVLVPLGGSHRLDWSQLGALTLEFPAVGQHTIYVDDVTFKSGREAPVPLTSDRDAAQLSTPDGHASGSRAMWIWDAAPLLNDPAATERLCDFCQRHQIGCLWVQLSYDLVPQQPPGSHPAGQPDAPNPPSVRCVLRHPEQWRRLLGEVHRRAIQIQALDGYPEFCLPARHQTPLAIVDAVIDFNLQAASDERFDGVHFDNEPYLLIGWADRDCRETILQGFLELNAECQRRVEQHRPLQFGVDIPFWWQDRPSPAEEPPGQVTFREKRQPASLHCLDLLDNVGIMNYRDCADGADGMIAHGRELLEYGDRTGRAKIYMGVETSREPPTRVWFPVGLPSPVFRDRLQDAGRDMSLLSRLEGLRLRTLDTDTIFSVGLEVPSRPAADQRGRFLRAARALSESFAASCTPSSASLAETYRQQLISHLSKDAEWQDARACDLKLPPDDAAVAGVAAESVMLSKITFADDTAEHLQLQLQAADDYFRRYRCYAGLALHYFETYRDKIEPTGRTP